jgi:trehalose 2-sulfotransferase
MFNRLDRPERSYLVCATPRSGSTLLCEALAATGVAGHPEEYFEARRATGAPRSARDYFDQASEAARAALAALGEVPPAEPPEYSSLRGIDDYAEHLRAALARGTGSNGVFGAKLMWMHLDDFLELARTVPGLGGASLAEVLGALFPGAAFVWVRRQDKVRQAVSLWRAIQTQAWRAGQGPREPVRQRYNFAAIDFLRERLANEDAAWARFFTDAGVEPLELEYERVGADVTAAVRAVLERVGVDRAGVDPPSPLMRRQADELSESWVQRYRTQAGRREARAG